MTGERSDQLNCVPNRGISDLRQNPANQVVAKFAPGALAARSACNGCSAQKKTYRVTLQSVQVAIRDVVGRNYVALYVQMY
jgi:hypothetical protein